jgi:methylated-DNA-[protein]-cysteine S-methyltransferase
MVRMKRLNPSQVFRYLRQTRFGPICIVWSDWRGEPKIVQVVLSRPGMPGEQAVGVLFPAVPSLACARIDSVADKLEGFLDGADIRFSLGAVRLDLCSPFQQRVLRAEHGIPRGRLSTYKRIAVHLAKPNAARAVGTALARNPFPVIIPCHRAIRSDRTLGGYQGGIAMKRALLEAEGIAFDAMGRVAGESRFYYGSEAARKRRS